MSDADDIQPPLPTEHAAPTPAWQAGCIILGGLALIPFFYAGSFAYLITDARNDWGVTRSLDEDILNIVYAPLIWILTALEL